MITPWARDLLAHGVFKYDYVIYKSIIFLKYIFFIAKTDSVFLNYFSKMKGYCSNLLTANQLERINELAKNLVLPFSI